MKKRGKWYEGREGGWKGKEWDETQVKNDDERK